jgi:serine/threonine protein kinase
MDEASDPFANTPYRTLAFLGTGGSALIYEVEHRSLRQRRVAKLLKESLADDPQVVERMWREGNALVAAAHPNLLEVFDFGYTDDGIPYLVTERLDGNDLRQELLRRGPLPLLEAIRYAEQAAAALETAHQKGIVHRDVKPENLFLHQKSPGVRELKVLDLGLAKMQGSAAESQRYPTEEGTLVGTPHYMAPEVVRDEKIDHRVDVYALGAVLYEMLVGSGPFDHLKSAHRVLRAHVDVPPEPPSRRSTRRLPRSLDRVVLKALAKNARERFSSAAELEASLKQIEIELTQPIIPSIAALSALVTGSITFLVLWALFGVR